MTALTIITQLFLALPLLALVVNNAVPREKMRYSTIGMSTAVAGMQIVKVIHVPNKLVNLILKPKA